MELGYCYITCGLDLDRHRARYSELNLVKLQQQLNIGNVKPDYLASISRNEGAIKTELSLHTPIMLGKMNHNLFEEIAIMLIKYSNLLVYADDYLSVSEDMILNDLMKSITLENRPF